MKKAIIVHGWGGSPEGDWYQWLKKELEKKGFKVLIPEMPETMFPKIEAWVSKLNQAAGEADENTYFIGHSIGCQTILRYLEKLPANKKIGGAILVAGWFSLTENTWDENYTQEIALPWLETKIDFEKVKEHTDKIIVFLSDNDPYIPLSDFRIFREKLDADVIIENGKGHFSGEDGITKYPAILNKLLQISK